MGKVRKSSGRSGKITASFDAVDFDWNALRYFLALARNRHLTQAANDLGVDHTTVRRRISALEAAINSRLIDADDSGFLLTAKGRRLFAFAEEMENLVSKIKIDIVEADENVSGTVRVSAVYGVGTYFLGPRLPALCARYPSLDLQLITRPHIANITKREADIAIAAWPPKRGAEVIRKLGEFHLGLYATESYLKRFPPITRMEDLAKHRIIGFINEVPFAPRNNFFPRPTTIDRVQFESDSVAVQVKAVTNGFGIAVLSPFIVHSEPLLRPVLHDAFRPKLECWLITHRELRNLARVRTVIDFIVEEFAAAKFE